MSKIIYKKFCDQNYVPIYSKPWWMDAVCGEENWNVWIYEKSGTIQAAMPYYIQRRESYRYVTKAPLTQNNGLIISYPEGQKNVSKQSYEEEIINAAVEHIEKMGLDVYEQQYVTDFHNFLPFFWHHYEIIPRITYVIENTEDLKTVFDNFTSNYRKDIRKGKKFITSFSGESPENFYFQHEKIFLRQNIPCPFSYEIWMRLYNACTTHYSGEIVTARDELNTILSLAFFVWDEKTMYLLLGGSIPAHASKQTYVALVMEGIRMASERGLKFDFEGSVIKRINHAFREYGGTPKQYFRIRKVFNPEIIRAEAEQKIRGLSEK